MKIQLLKDELADKARSLISKYGRMFPVRCQLCGSWGHSNTGRRWICDACYAEFSVQFSAANEYEVEYEENTSRR